MNINVTHGSPPLAALRSADGNGVQQEQISIGGVVLLSALAVTLTIVGVLLLGALMVGAWWLASHIPVPPLLGRLLSHL